MSTNGSETRGIVNIHKIRIIDTNKDVVFGYTTYDAAYFQDELLVDAREGVVDGGGDGGDEADRGAEAERDQHQEEEDGEQLRNEVELGQHLTNQR